MNELKKEDLQVGTTVVFQPPDTKRIHQELILEVYDSHVLTATLLSLVYDPFEEKFRLRDSQGQYSPCFDLFRSKDTLDKECQRTHAWGQFIYRLTKKRTTPNIAIEEIQSLMKRFGID